MSASVRLRRGSRFGDAHRGPAGFGSPVTTGGAMAPIAGDGASGRALPRGMRCGWRRGGNAVAEAGTEPLDTGIPEDAGPGGNASNRIGEAGRWLTAPAVADL